MSSCLPCAISHSRCRTYMNPFRITRINRVTHNNELNWILNDRNNKQNGGMYSKLERGAEGVNKNNSSVHVTAMILNVKWCWQRINEHHHQFTKNPSSAIKNEPKHETYQMRAHMGENSDIAFQNMQLHQTMSEMFVCVRKINHITNSFSNAKTIPSKGIPKMGHTYLLWQFQHEFLQKINNNSSKKRAHTFFLFDAESSCGKKWTKINNNHSEDNTQAE